MMQADLLFFPDCSTCSSWRRGGAQASFLSADLLHVMSAFCPVLQVTSLLVLLSGTVTLFTKASMAFHQGQRMQHVGAKFYHHVDITKGLVE